MRRREGEPKRMEELRSINSQSLGLVVDVLSLDDFSRLNDRQKKQLWGAGGFLYSADRAMQKIDFQDPARPNPSEGNIYARKKVLEALYPMLYGEGAVIPRRLPKSPGIEVQQKLALFRRILFNIYDGELLSSEDQKLIPQIITFFLRLGGQQSQLDTKPDTLG